MEEKIKCITSFKVQFNYEALNVEDYKNKSQKIKELVEALGQNEEIFKDTDIKATEVDTGNEVVFWENWYYTPDDDDEINE